MVLEVERVKLPISLNQWVPLHRWQITWELACVFGLGRGRLLGGTSWLMLLLWGTSSYVLLISGQVCIPDLRPHILFVIWLKCSLLSDVCDPVTRESWNNKLIQITHTLRILTIRVNIPISCIVIFRNRSAFQRILAQAYLLLSFGTSGIMLLTILIQITNTIHELNMALTLSTFLLVADRFILLQLINGPRWRWHRPIHAHVIVSYSDQITRQSVTLACFLSHFANVAD